MDKINHENNLLITVVILFILLYVLNLNKIKLPTCLINLFNNTIFKIVFLSLLLIFTFKKYPYVAIAIALIFILILEYLNIQQTNENIAYFKVLKEQNKQIII